MKTLFMSDLDGTLLNNQAELLPETMEMLNACIEGGVHVSINTARTPATVFQIMRGVPLNEIISMMNGVLLYDPQVKDYYKIHDMSRETAMVVLGIIKLYNLQCFVYTMEERELHTYYDSVASRSLNKFRNERILRYDKKFTEVEDLSIVAGNGVIYFTLREERAKLENLHRDLKAVKGIQTSMYQDIYNEEWYFLEIYSEDATKKRAVDEIRTQKGYDCVIGFGDSANDIPMFEACDYNYAVANATEEIQNMATNIIPSNIENGVVRFIQKVTTEA